MSLFNENPQLIFDNIKELLNLAVKDRHHSFHIPVFINIKQKNIPVARIVVLRHFDEKKFVINFHTDIRSSKISELRINNKSSFLFYDPKIKIQLRIKTISKINNLNKKSKIFWNKTRLMSRKCYLTQKSPGSIIKIPEDGIPKHLKGLEPSEKESEFGYKNFTVIQNQISEIEWLNLAASGHKRLKIEIINNKPKFNWLIP